MASDRDYGYSMSIRRLTATWTVVPGPVLQPCTSAASLPAWSASDACVSSAVSACCARLRAARDKEIRVSRASSARTSWSASAGVLIATDCTIPRLSSRSRTREAAVTRCSLACCNQPNRLDQASTVASGNPSSRAAARGPIATTSTLTASLSTCRAAGIMPRRLPQEHEKRKQKISS